MTTPICGHSSSVCSTRWLSPSSGFFLATIIGFIVGLARLSKNYLVQKFATIYVEVLRNIPLLLQLLFWYKAVLSILPSPRVAGP
jgi:general L-amino acid transport system permease protein